MRTATKSGHTHLDLCFCKLSTRGGLELLDRILNRGQIQKTNESTLLFVSYDRIKYLATLCVSGTKRGKKRLNPMPVFIKRRTDAFDECTTNFKYINYFGIFYY